MQTSSYLNDVNFLSAVVPNFKLLAVASDVFRDPDSAHLETGTPNGDHSDATVDPPAANVYLPRLFVFFPNKDDAGRFCSSAILVELSVGGQRSR